MIRIICPKCKNAYLDDSLVCPDCSASFEKAEENLLLGAQYYNEGDYDKANDCLMKYIVQNGADAQAMFYKALCDSFSFDEDTISLSDTYTKLFQSLKEIPQELFPSYLALANDEAQRLEKAIAEMHVNLLIDADAEKIKKEVSTIISLQNEAKAFRIKLNALVNEYNNVAAAKISVKLSDCFLVEPEIAIEIGEAKFNKIAENIASHTVFTGILSTDIKNLEIYYRCIVMFFKRNRQKYEFLMASAEKFNELSTLLENGQYSSIKGTSAIGDKLKSVGYDFFQESLKDHDEEFEAQAQTVVVLEPEEAEAEDTIALDDVSEATVIEIETSEEEPTEEPQIEDVSSTSDAEAVAEEDTESVDENNVDIAESCENASDDTSAETEVAPAEAEPEADTTVSADVIEIPAEAEEIEASEEEDSKAAAFKVVIPEEEISAASVEPEEAPAEVTEDAPQGKKTRKRKKSYAPFITAALIIIGIIAIICVSVIPEKINESNYAKANDLFQNEKYEQAAQVYAELGDYEDSQDKLNEAKYNHAAQLEKAEKYEEAKKIYDELDTYEDSMAKSSSCVYNLATSLLDEGKFDEAKALFSTITDYADSKTQIQKCDFLKASSYVDNKNYEEAIKILTALGDYPSASEKILEAKYKYIKDNYSKDNATTVKFIEELIEVRYQDIAAVKRDLLGPAEEEKPVAKPEEKPVERVTSCINYVETDYTENLKEADKTKAIYFHVTVNDEALYGKKLTIKFTTAFGYSEQKTYTFKKGSNTFALLYPRTDISGYTVDFTVLNGSDVLKTQTITIK